MEQFNNDKRESLTDFIEERRKQMLEIAWDEGVDSTKTLMISQELDQLIIKKQKLLNKAWAYKVDKNTIITTFL